MHESMISPLYESKFLAQIALFKFIQMSISSRSQIIDPDVAYYCCYPFPMSQTHLSIKRFVLKGI